MAFELTDDGRTPEGYKVNANGIIIDPGKFEGEPAYLPYLWQTGNADEDVYEGDNCYLVWFVTDDDRTRYPNLLSPENYAIVAYERESGFVESETMDRGRFDAWKREIEQAQENEPDEDAITTTDHETFWQYGKRVLWGYQTGPHCPEGTEGLSQWFCQTNEHPHIVCLGIHLNCESALQAYMDRVQFWPDVWFISDHGNAHRIDLSEKE